MTLILKFNVAGRGAEEWVGVWLTHLLRISCISSCKTQYALLSHLSVVRLSFWCFSSIFTVDSLSLWSPAPPEQSIPMFYWSGAASCRHRAGWPRPTSFSSRTAHARSHQESLKVTWFIGAAINSSVTGVKKKAGENVRTPRHKFIFSRFLSAVSGQWGAVPARAVLKHVGMWPARSGDQLSLSEYPRCVCVLGTIARRSGFRRVFWPTYCCRRSAPEKSVLISRLSCRPVCCH